MCRILLADVDGKREQFVVMKVNGHKVSNESAATDITVTLKLE
jgi:hypothetical protein